MQPALNKSLNAQNLSTKENHKRSHMPPSYAQSVKLLQSKASKSPKPNPKKEEPIIKVEYSAKKLERSVASALGHNSRTSSASKIP